MRQLVQASCRCGASAARATRSLGALVSAKLAAEQRARRSLSRGASLLAAMLCAAVLPLAQAEAGQAESLQMLEGEAVAAELLGLTGNLALFAVGEEQQSLSWRQGEFFRWGSPRELRGGQCVLLGDGSLLAGDVLAVGAQGVLLEHDVFGLVEIPRRHIRGAVLARPAAPLELDRLVGQLAVENAPADTLWLENGDRLVGAFPPYEGAPRELAFGGQAQVKLVRPENVLEVPWARIGAVQFASSPAELSQEMRLQVGLRDGDVLRVAALVPPDSHGGAGAMSLTLAGGLTLEARNLGVLLGEVVALRPLPPYWKPLSELPPLAYKHVPLVGLPVELVRDGNVRGGRLRSGNALCSQGWGMPGGSRVAFRLDGSPQTLLTEIGIDDAAGRRGSCVFRIYLKRAAGSLTPVFSSNVLRGGDSRRFVRLDVSDAELLVLLVDRADRGDELDYANWLAPVLVPRKTD